MPYKDPEKQKQYQADLMRRKRAGEPQRAYGNEIIKPGVYEAGHIHQWLRKMGEDTATCVGKDWQPEGGCGEVVKWQGKMLNVHTDGLPPMTEMVRDMDQHDRDKILSSPMVNQPRARER